MRRLLILVVLLALSCGRPPERSYEKTAGIRVPRALLVERIIAGDVHGNHLKNPFGLTVTINGSVYVCDAGNHRLIKFDPGLKAKTEMGGYGFAAGFFNRPSFVTLDNFLNLVVSDEGNRRVVRLNTRLAYVDEIILSDDDDPFKYGYPSGVAVTGYGELWVADRDKDRIVVFDNVGKFDRFIGDFGYRGGQLSSPEKILTDIYGNFVVCDAGNARLVVYDCYGSFSHEVSDDTFEYPIAAVFERDHLWVLDGVEGYVLCLDYRNDMLFKTGPVLMGERVPLKTPSDIAVLPDGRLLISDSGNNRLLVCRVIYEDH